MLPQLVLATEN